MMYKVSYFPKNVLLASSCIGTFPIVLRKFYQQWLFKADFSFSFSLFFWQNLTHSPLPLLLRTSDFKYCLCVFEFAGGPIVVRTEEVLIVVFVLILWAAAIALFFNRWGKIRMLEPYQPKFHEEEHRPSCPLNELANPAIAQVRIFLFCIFIL